MFALKMICLFLAILFTLVNTSRVSMKADIPAVNYILQAVGIFGFVYLHYLS